MPVRGRGAQSPACGIARHQSAQRPSHRLVAKAQAHQGLACGMHGPDEIQQLPHPGQAVVVDRRRTTSDDVAVEVSRSGGQYPVLDRHHLIRPFGPQWFKKLHHLLPVVRKMRSKCRGVVVGQQNGHTQVHKVSLSFLHMLIILLPTHYQD